MSLLMDALKRAEKSKQDAARSLSGQDPQARPPLSLEPVATENRSPLPELSAHINAVDADLAASMAPAPPPIKPPPSAARTAPADRDAVRNAFAAKQAASLPSRRPIWLIVGLLGMAGLGIAGYVGYQLQAIGRHSLAPESGRTPTAASETPPRSTAAPALPAVPVPPAILPASPPAEPPSQLNASMAPESRPYAPPTRPLRPAPTTATASETGEANTGIKLTRSRKPELDSKLVSGHHHMQRNELDLARQDYEQALQRDPNSTDALLALVAIAQHQGRPADAERLRQRALVANPSDPAVQAAVLNGAAASADPQNAESRLKSLLAAQPESAPLNFALGNLYARQQRWSEAQQAYFSAVAAEGDNPDYLFNLAVSLEHLRQTRLAAQHYRLALEAAGARPAAFDRERVRQRLGELQP